MRKAAYANLADPGKADKRGFQTALTLAILIASFALLQACLPLSTAVKIGADEGFELAKTTLVLHGHRLYTEIWNDQPPLQTVLLVWVLRHVSPSVLGLRLVTVGFAALLLGAVFVLVRRCGTGSLSALPGAGQGHLNPESAVEQRRREDAKLCETGAHGNRPARWRHPQGEPSISSATTPLRAFAPSLLIPTVVSGLRQAGGAVLLAALSTALLMAAPAFLELSGSVMQEIPALALAVAGLAGLVCGRPTRWRGAEIGAGLLFAVALQMKLIGAIYLPLAAFILWLRCRAGESQERESGEGREKKDGKNMGGRRIGAETSSCPQSSCRRAFLLDWFLPAGLMTSLMFFAASLAVAFVALPFLVGEGAFFQHFRQSWEAHFAAPRTFGYGSPEEHGFDWGVLLRNWDTTVPAALGIALCLRQARRTSLAILPVVWLALTFVVFGAHKPWWTYYYVHNAVPLCWCAGIGLVGVWQFAWTRRPVAFRVLLGLFTVGAAGWMGARVYLQITGIRHGPQTYSRLVLPEIARLKPFTEFFYTDEPVYSFHAGIPLPPRLGVISLKRFWSGDLSNEELTAELQRVKPGVMLLATDTRELPFSDFLHAEYRLVYEDAAQRLYAHQTVLEQARQARARPAVRNEPEEK